MLWVVAVKYICFDNVATHDSESWISVWDFTKNDEKLQIPTLPLLDTFQV